MQLVRDVLDQQIIDSRQEKSGKVDGIALEIRAGEPPRVAYLDIGTNVLARRLSPRLEQILRRIRRRVRRGESKPFQVPWSTVESVDVSVTVTVDATEYSSYHVEEWLCDNVICRIPGNAHHKHQEHND
jgi:sporulation protein YlmC with PRC-barrel domain